MNIIRQYLLLDTSPYDDEAFQPRGRNSGMKLYGGGGGGKGSKPPPPAPPAPPAPPPPEAPAPVVTAATAKGDDAAGKRKGTGSLRIDRTLSGTGSSGSGLNIPV